MSGTVVVFVSHSPLDSSPSIINSARLLARAGYRVLIIAEETYNDEGAFATNQIVVHRLDAQKPRWKRAARRLAGPVARALATAPEHKIVAGSRIRKALDLVSGEDVRCVIAFDPYGLVFAGAVIDMLPGTVPLVYWSLELYLSHDHEGLAYSDELKALERRYNARAIATVIQDAERAQLLATDNHLTDPRLILVPNGPIGPAVRQKTSYLREWFGIEAGKRIILHAGGINEFGCAKAVARAARDFPDDWVLVMHGQIHPDYVGQLRAEMAPGTIISNELVPYEQLPNLIASADVGVALYQNLSLGLYHIAAASGKIAHYLQCGLPVVTSDFENLKKSVEAPGCGVCVAGASELVEAVERIFADYDSYRLRAFRCFEERYEFSRPFGEIIGLIDSLPRGNGP